MQSNPVGTATLGTPPGVQTSWPKFLVVAVVVAVEEIVLDSELVPVVDTVVDTVDESVDVAVEVTDVVTVVEGDVRSQDWKVPLKNPSSRLLSIVTSAKQFTLSRCPVTEQE